MSLAPHTDPAGDDGRFRLAMASSGIGMAIVDLDGRWLEVNPALERILGHAASALVGRSVFDSVHPDDVADSRAAARSLADGTLPMLDAQRRYLHRSGETVWLHVNAAVMRDPDGAPAYFIAQLRDVTAQRHAEDALQAWSHMLESRVAERTAELEKLARQQDLFAYGVSHDLRAPLRAIDGFATLLANQHAGQLDDSGRGYLERIRGATTRMGGLLDALLELSRASRSELRPGPVDVSLVAEWVGAELQDADPERAADITVAEGLVAHGDERHIKLLLTQLMQNAWKFSRDRDRVRIDVTGKVVDGRLVVTVRDQGIGFDMRYADRMFEPFQRLHGPEEAGGNGLGLAIAQRIAERHGGRIWAESTPGEGSTFHVELPLAADSEETP